MFFLNVFHHDARSLLDGGETAVWGVKGTGASRCEGRLVGCGVDIGLECPVAMKATENTGALRELCKVGDEAGRASFAILK